MTFNCQRVTICEYIHTGVLRPRRINKGNLLVDWSINKGVSGERLDCWRNSYIRISRILYIMCVNGG